MHIKNFDIIFIVHSSHNIVSITDYISKIKTIQIIIILLGDFLCVNFENKKAN